MSDTGFYFAVGLLLAGLGNMNNLNFIVDAFAAAGAFIILGIGAAYIYYKVKTDDEN